VTYYPLLFKSVQYSGWVFVIHTEERRSAFFGSLSGKLYVPQLSSLCVTDRLVFLMGK
jgi:hypothetical protein